MRLLGGKGRQRQASCQRKRGARGWSINLIKRSRAALSRDDVNTFFDNFEKTVAGISPENIYNCDETNLQDNPGAKKAIFSLGVKYAEQIQDNSKTSISIMFCGSATGDFLPSHIIYKGQNVYDSWCKGGQKGTYYTSTSSGWFDTYTFCEWFRRISSSCPPPARQEAPAVLQFGLTYRGHRSLQEGRCGVCLLAC